MPYTTINTLAVTTATGGIQYYRGNSIYDPDYTSTGTTARGWSVWSPMYDFY